MVKREKKMIHLFIQNERLKEIEDYLNEMQISRNLTSVVAEIVEMSIPKWIAHQRKAYKGFLQVTGESE